MNLYNDSEIMGKDPVNEKIKKIYHRKHPNYKNIETFSVILPSIRKKSALEGLESSITIKGNTAVTGNTQVPKCPGTDWAQADSRKESDDEYIASINSIAEAQYSKDTNAFVKGIKNIEEKVQKYINKVRDIADEQYDKAYAELHSKYKDVENNIPTSMSDIKEKVKDMDTDSKKSVQDQIADAIVAMNKVFKGFTTIINIILTYISLSIVRLAYAVPPGWPIDLFNENNPNYPWNINFGVSSADNLETGGNLYSESSPAVNLDGVDIAPSKYIQNQQIQYDTQVIMKFFIQFILVLVSYLITKNLVYNIEMETGPKWFFDEPIGTTDPPQNLPIFESGFSIIFKCIKNTIFSTPYNVFVFIFWVIKLFLQTIRIYNYKELTFILLFLIILHLCLKYFLKYYNSFTEDPITWTYQPIVLLFVFYGIFENYLNVQMIKYEYLHSGKQIPVSHNWVTVINIFVLLILFFIIYPVLRITAVFWFIYLFIYNKGNGLRYDILSDKKTTNCGQKEGIFGTINRIVSKYIYPNFLYFVILVLVVFNVYNSFKNDKIYNPAIKHIMIGFSLMMLLGLILYAAFMFFNKNNAKTSNDVKYYPGHKNNPVKSGIKDLKLDSYPPPIIPPPIIPLPKLDIVEKEVPNPIAPLSKLKTVEATSSFPLNDILKNNPMVDQIKNLAEVKNIDVEKNISNIINVPK
jgi:hypothetical protein